jgi:hypothetical protein
LGALTLADGTYTLNYTGWTANADPTQYLGLGIYVNGVQYDSNFFNYQWGKGSQDFTYSLNLASGGSNVVQVKVIDDMLSSAQVGWTSLEAVRFNTVVPEPTSLVMLLSGAITTFLAYTWRRKKVTRFPKR